VSATTEPHVAETGSRTALLTVDQVASHCGLSRRAIYRAIERGELLAYKPCGRLRIAPEDFEAWIRSSVVERVRGTTTDHEPRARTATRGFRDRIRAAGQGS
jgi:excisionase family DNA binding protein